jgi:hypothetical protein
VGGGSLAIDRRKSVGTKSSNETEANVPFCNTRKMFDFLGAVTAPRKSNLVKMCNANT